MHTSLLHTIRQNGQAVALFLGLLLFHVLGVKAAHIHRSELQNCSEHRGAQQVEDDNDCALCLFTLQAALAPTEPMSMAPVFSTTCYLCPPLSIGSVAHVPLPDLRGPPAFFI